MKVKIRERMDQLLRIEENRRAMSDALARGAPQVTLKDGDTAVTIHLQRSRELTHVTR